MLIDTSNGENGTPCRVACELLARQAIRFPESRLDGTIQGFHQLPALPGYIIPAGRQTWANHTWTRQPVSRPNHREHIGTRSREERGGKGQTG